MHARVQCAGGVQVVCGAQARELVRETAVLGYIARVARLGGVLPGMMFFTTVNVDVMVSIAAMNTSAARATPMKSQNNKKR